jgi:mono/diheme cytochrome c family protein
MQTGLQAEPMRTTDMEAGEKIYMKNCEVCHLIGRNLLNPAKEIQNSAIVADPKKLRELLSHKNGIMPQFAHIAKNDTELKQLREFLLYAQKNPSEVRKLEDEEASGKAAKKESKSKNPK